MRPGIQTGDIGSNRRHSGRETRHDVELMAVRRVLTRRTGRSGRKRTKFRSWQLRCGPRGSELRGSRRHRGLSARSTGMKFREIDHSETSSSAMFTPRSRNGTRQTGTVTSSAGPCSTPFAIFMRPPPRLLPCAENRPRPRRPALAVPGRRWPLARANQRRASARSAGPRKGCPPGGTRSAAHADSHAQRSEHGVVGRAASAAGQPGREAMRPDRKEDRQ